MNIDRQIVRAIFLDLLDGRISRAAADRWAYDVMQKADAGTLTFTPSADQERIWDAVTYLYGIDLMEAPGKYLHTDKDVETAMILKLGLT